MSADRNMLLIFCVVLLVAIFIGCVEKPTKVTGQVNTEALETLFSKYSLPLNMSLEEVSIYSLDGVEVASQREVALGNSFSFQVPSGAAYFLKARTVDGVNLWAITPLISQDIVQNVDLNTTYEATLIVASLGTVPPTKAQVSDLKQNATLALNQDIDRLVKTVKRVVDHAALKRIDYSPLTEVSKETLRAFGGGLEPVRSLEAILSTPEPEYFPYIYAGRLLTNSEPNNIVITEIKAERWDYRVQGIRGTVPVCDFNWFSRELEPHVISGGTTLVFTSDRACFEQPSPCPCTEGVLHVVSAIYTIPLDASADTPPTRLTPLNFDAKSPAWSWDEEKIVFSAGPIERPEWMEETDWLEYQNRLKSWQNPLGVGTQIYVMNKDGTGLTQLTFDENPSVRNREPAWSPDNKQIVYASNRTGDVELWIMNSDGSGNTQLTNSPGSNENHPSFSPDGRQIVFDSDRDGDWEIFVMDRDGSNLKQLTNNSVNDYRASWAHSGLDIVHINQKEITSISLKEAWQRGFSILLFPGGRMIAVRPQLVGLSTLTGETLFDFVDFANAISYDFPVWAATNHVLIPSKKIIAAGQFTEEGYVTEEGEASRTATANPQSQGAFEIKENPQDPLSAYHHEIYSAVPNFVPAPLVW